MKVGFTYFLMAGYNHLSGDGSHEIDKGRQMGQLAFLDEDRLFDGQCVRFKGYDGKDEVTCGVTIVALKECDPALQRHGLIPAEAFLASFEKIIVAVHDAARRKYERGEFEAEGSIRIMVHRRDLAA